MDDLPNNARVNAVISMTQHVAEAADALPRLIGRKRLGLVSQPPSSLADDQERVQDGVKCLLVSGKTISIKPCREPLYSIDILKESANLCICFSEDKRRISLDSAPQPLLANRLTHNIDRAA